MIVWVFSGDLPRARKTFDDVERVAARHPKSTWRQVGCCTVCVVLCLLFGVAGACVDESRLDCHVDRSVHHCSRLFQRYSGH